jgi:hypothetical protein
MKAYLHPPIHKTGVPYSGRYDVTFEGETVVKGSKDPETDLARALLAKGITGKVMVLDANTHKHRTTVNIEKAAKLSASGGYFVEYRQKPRKRPSSPEDDLVVPTMPGEEDEAVA